MPGATTDVETAEQDAIYDVLLLHSLTSYLSYFAANMLCEKPQKEKRRYFTFTSLVILISSWNCLRFKVYILNDVPALLYCKNIWLCDIAYNELS